jgi:AbrB family looped-hinge helix DNA binding protein
VRGKAAPSDGVGGDVARPAGRACGESRQCFALACHLGLAYPTFMSSRTQLSAKGQIVIPKRLRDAHDWQPGTAFEVIDRPDGVLLRPTTPMAKRLTLAEFRALLPRHQGPAVPLEDMEAAIDAERAARWANGKS